jgi:soluble lytic murein transglycosylase-like protein
MSPRCANQRLRIAASSRDPVRRPALRFALGLTVALTFTSHAFAQTAPPVSQSRAGSIANFVDQASRRFRIPADWIIAVMRVESAGNVRATSTAGAMGLMQIMPSTWSELRARYRLGPDPYDAHDNIVAGTAYLRELYDRYGSPGFLAAYNAGPGRYEDYLAGRPLPGETRLYLARLSPRIGGDASPVGADAPDPLAWTRAGLFVRRDSEPHSSSRPVAEANAVPQPTDTLTVPEPQSGPDRAGLFIALSGNPR